MTPSLSLRPIWMLLAALVGGFLFTYLFFANEYIGLNVPFFVILMCATVLLLSQLQGIRVTKTALCFAAAAIVLSTTFAYRHSEPLLALNGLALLVMLTYAAMTYQDSRLFTSKGIALLLVLPLQAFGYCLWLALPVLRGVRKDSTANSKSKARWLPVLRGLLFALPILLVFGFFLSSADANFASLLRNIITFDQHTLERVFWSLVIAWLGLGVMYLCYAPEDAYRLWQHFLFGGAKHGIPLEGGEQESDTHSEPDFNVRFAPVEVCTVLAMVLLMFGMFVYVQFATLFGGDENIRQPGITYSSHARAGFFQLLVVAAMCFAMLLACRRYTAFEREQVRVNQVFTALSVGLIIASLIILYSAQSRMDIYELAYGYSTKRLYTSVFMFWLAVLFVWFMASYIPRYAKRLNFNVGAVLVGFAAVMHLNILNPDATIAENNLERYSDTGKIDEVYVKELSDDAALVLFNAPSLMGDDGETPNKHSLSYVYSALNDFDCTGLSAYKLRFHIGTYRIWRALPDAHSTLYGKEVRGRYCKGI